MHPGCVWAVAFLPNEDLVTGCADGIVRVWSTSDERKVAQGDELVIIYWRYRYQLF